MMQEVSDDVPLCQTSVYENECSSTDVTLPETEVVSSDSHVESEPQVVTDTTHEKLRQLMTEVELLKNEQDTYRREHEQ